MALAAEALQVQPRMLEARSPSEIDNAFAMATRERLDAVLVLADPMLTSQRKKIVELALRARLPLLAYFQDFAEAGALVTMDRTPSRSSVSSPCTWTRSSRARSRRTFPSRSL